jgi:hypothetical protein
MSIGVVVATNVQPSRSSLLFYLISSFYYSS